MQKILSQEKILFLIILLFSFIVYLPILSNPSLLLNRGNDLQEFFWPLIFYSRYHILQNFTLPLWNNLFLSGMPLLADPQSPLFYPINSLFLILPLNIGFITSLIFHSVLGSVGCFLLAKHGLRLSKFSGFFTALLYTTTPKLLGHVEAGHFGVIATYGWLPYIPLAIFFMTRKYHISWSILYAISLAGLFFTHTPTFLLAFAASVILFLVFSYQEKQFSTTNLYRFTISVIGVFGLVAITLLPQLAWKDQTTRVFLQNPTIYPQWSTKIEFLQAFLWPWKSVASLDTEKWIAPGFITFLLSIAGFLSINQRWVKILLMFTGITAIIFTLNNLLPIYQILKDQSAITYLRVLTRIWFIPNLIFILLAGYGLEKLLSAKTIYKPIIILFAIFALLEVTTLAWLRLNKPLPNQTKYAPLEIYEFLEKDPERFRVFCVNRCLSQSLSAKYHLELTEGYSTLQQKNYFNQFIQLSQVYWNAYTLALPPFEVYNFQEIQPHAPELADYNVKYVIAPYPLKDQHLTPIKQFGNYTVYQNLINKSRAYFSDGQNTTISSYSPNEIIIDTTTHKSNELILSEVYSPGWNAYLNGIEKKPIEETKNALRKVTINSDTKFVKFTYNPPGFTLGKMVTILTIGILFSTLIALRLKTK